MLVKGFLRIFSLKFTLFYPTNKAFARLFLTYNLFNLGFNQFEKVIALRKGFSVGDPIPIAGGKERSAILVASDNAVILVKKGEKELIKQDINISVHTIIAPASQGTSFGEAVISVGDQPVSRIDLVVEEDIKKGHIFDRLKWWFVDKVS